MRVRLQLKNLSNDESFAPFDHELRARPPNGGMPEMFLETEGGGRVGPYPLAPESEWSIAGQSFAPLKPGQSAETVLNADPSPPSPVSDPIDLAIPGPDGR